MSSARWKSENLITLGMMTASVVHEMSNHLSAISLMLERIDDRKSKNYRDAIEPLAELVQDLRAIARMDAAPVQATDLRAVLERVSRLAPFLLEERASLQIQVNDALPFVRANGTQLCQVLINLIKNAAQAFSEGSDTNQITLRGRRLGRVVLLDICDNGPGISTETIGQVLDPFYTTKSDGTGLGLSIAEEAVRSFGGTLAVESLAGAGTTVRLTLRAWGDEISSSRG